MLQYKNLKAVQEHLKVSDEQVDRQINALLEQRMKIVPVTGRATQLDDEVVLDYAGEVNGEYFPGGTAEKQTLVLGSGMFIPGFEEQLIGKNIGDDVDVHVTFPTQYHAEELAGKAAVFHCKIHEIRLKEKYKADDVFAQEVGGCKTFEEFRCSICAALQAYADGQSEAEVKEDMLDQVCESGEFDISDEQVQAALDLEMQSLENQLARQGLNMDMYCQFTGQSREQIREDHTGIARRNIARQLAITEIAEAEGIEPDEESIAAKLTEICQENNMTIEQLEPHMDDNFQMAVHQSVVTDKVLDFLMEHAEIEVVEK